MWGGGSTRTSELEASECGGFEEKQPSRLSLFGMSGTWRSVSLAPRQNVIGWRGSCKPTAGGEERRGNTEHPRRISQPLPLFPFQHRCRRRLRVKESQPHAGEIRVTEEKELFFTPALHTHNCSFSSSDVVTRGPVRELSFNHLVICQPAENSPAVCCQFPSSSARVRLGRPSRPNLSSPRATIMEAD